MYPSATSKAIKAWGSMFVACKICCDLCTSIQHIYVRFLLMYLTMALAGDFLGHGCETTTDVHDVCLVLGRRAYVSAVWLDIALWFKVWSPQIESSDQIFRKTDGQTLQPGLQLESRIEPISSWPWPASAATRWCLKEQWNDNFVLQTRVVAPTIVDLQLLNAAAQSQHICRPCSAQGRLCMYVQRSKDLQPRFQVLATCCCTCLDKP